MISNVVDWTVPNHQRKTVQEVYNQGHSVWVTGTVAAPREFMSVFFSLFETKCTLHNMIIKRWDGRW